MSRAAFRFLGVVLLMRCLMTVANFWGVVGRDFLVLDVTLYSVFLDRYPVWPLSGEAFNWIFFLAFLSLSLRRIQTFFCDDKVAMYFLFDSDHCRRQSNYIASVLSVYIQCDVSVYPVWCQCVSIVMSVCIKCDVSVMWSSNYSIENPYYLHRTCIGKINRNYPVTREVTDQGAQLVISVVPHLQHTIITQIYQWECSNMI